MQLLRTSEENAKSNGRHKRHCWTLLYFSLMLIIFSYYIFVQTSTITKLFMKVQIWLAQSFKGESSWLSTINRNLPFAYVYFYFLCLFPYAYFSDLILSSHILTLLVYYSFLTLFYLKNSRIDDFVSDTHDFLASHSVSSYLGRSFR